MTYHAFVRIRTCLALGLLWPATVRGQTASPDVEAIAAAQFERGLTAMNAGELDIGCPALAESVRLDPRAGAIFTLAECEARWQKWASAYAHYEEYLARYARMTPEQQRPQQERFTLATRRRAEISPKVPRMAVELPPGTRDVTVRRDGIELGPASLGVPLPVDPGPHEIVVARHGRFARTHANVGVGATMRVVANVPDADAPPRAPAPSRTSPWRTEGWLLVAAGGIGVGVGTTFGLFAMDRTSTIHAHCVGNACDAEGKAEADDAKRDATISTVAFVFGGAALAAGALLLFVPRSSSASLGSRLLRGTF
jgi:hypothetical protein